MRFVPSIVHGWVDYAMGIALMLSSVLVGQDPGGPMQWLPAVLGAALLVYSALTDYELGMIRFIPLRLHLMFDAAGGALLVAFGLLFAGYGSGTLIFTVLGLLEIGSSLVTSTTTTDGAGVAQPPGFAGRNTSMPAAEPPFTAAMQPRNPAAAQRPSNVAQLRRKIDSGQSRDKTAMTDPAMAPLGTDDEAAQPHDEAGLGAAREAKGRL